MDRPTSKHIKKRYLRGKPLCLVPTCNQVAEQYKNGNYKNYCGKHNYTFMRKFTSWEGIREVILARDKKCAVCNFKGDYFNPLQVDHIKEFAAGGDLWDENNLQVLCLNCHKRKTAEFNARRKLKRDIYEGVQKTL